MRNKRFSALALILTAAVTALVSVAAVVLTAWLLLGPGGLAVLQGNSIIQSRFVGDYDPSNVSDGALRGMAEALGDRWSGYMDPKTYAAMKERRTNSYVGIGVTYTAAPDRSAMDIASVAEGSPADKAGIVPGDRIVAINGTPLTPENFDALVDSIPGEVGEQRSLTVEKTDGARLEVTVTLAHVDSSPVFTEMLEGDVGYVRIENFYQRTAEETAAAVDALANQGARALLFDVRSNPGGYVSELTDLLDHLLPEGPIFTQRDKNGPVETIYSDAACVDLPMAVLVNGDSYSAAELFAAQLRESLGAPLIGEQTCGKGYYQQAFELFNGGALNISTGLYTTGGGVSLIGVGLTPDIVEADPATQLELARTALLEELER